MNGRPVVGASAVRLHLTRDGRRRLAEPSGDSAEWLTDRQPTADLLTICERQARLARRPHDLAGLPLAESAHDELDGRSASTRSPLRSRGSSFPVESVHSRRLAELLSGCLEPA